MVKKKKKYIIELPENTHWIQWIMESTKDHHPYMDYKQVEDLTPYTEPDMEQVRKEAWEAARKIAVNADHGGLSAEALREIFSVGTASIAYIFDNFSASEAIEKIRQYEQKQEEEKKESIIAEDIMRQYLNTFCNGRSCTCCPLDTPDFTCGRGYHFTSTNPISDEEVRRAYVEVRQKMEEN